MHKQVDLLSVQERRPYDYVLSWAWEKLMQIYGYAIPGQGFYAIETEKKGTQVEKKGVGAIISVLKGVHSTKIIENELRY